MATQFQYSCLENPMDKGAWLATIHRVAKLDMTEHIYTHINRFIIIFTQIIHKKQAQNKTFYSYRLVLWKVQYSSWHTGACLHLWRFAIWKFVCKGLNVIILFLLFSCKVMSDFMTPWTAACQASLSFTISQSFSKSCPLGWYCYLIISSSTSPFICSQSFPAPGSFPMSRLFKSGG